MSNAAEPSSIGRDIAIIALSIALSVGLVWLIWFVIDRYEGNPVFEGIVVLLVVVANVYAVVTSGRLLWMFFRRRR